MPILGQLDGAVATDELLYEVPVNTNVTARVIVTNRAASSTSFRVAAVPDGETLSLEHYLAYDKPIAGNETGSSIAVDLGAGDQLRVYSGNGNLSFTATGPTRAA